MIWATVSSVSFFLLTVYSFSIFSNKECNQSGFHIDHFVMTMCKSHFLCCWKKVFAIASAFSWQNSVSLCPASFCAPKPNLSVTASISWLPTFPFQSFMINRTSFLLVLVIGGLLGLHRIDQCQLLQHWWLRHRLGLQWRWVVSLGKEPRSFCHF